MIVLKPDRKSAVPGSGYLLYGKKPPIPMRFNVSKYSSLSSARQLENNVNALPALVRRMGRAQSTDMVMAVTATPEWPMHPRGNARRVGGTPAL
jgi:hypothetical protein